MNTKKLDWVTQATGSSTLLRTASVARKPVKKRAEVQAVAGPAYQHTLELSGGRVMSLMRLSLDDYKLKISLPAGLRRELQQAGERLAPTLVGLSDFALEQLERKGGKLVIFPCEDAGVEGLGCDFKHHRGAGAFQIEFARPFAYPPSDGRDRRVCVWIPDTLLTRVEATGAELGPAIAALSAWGLAYLRRKGCNLVTRAA